MESAWTAILPAAGLGTRMRPITGGAPKELLPLGGRPVLAYVIGEMRAAGATGVVLVGSAEKPALDRFVADLADPSVRIVHQARMRGLADAVAAADGAGPVVIANADSVILGPSPVAELAARVARDGWDAAVALREVPLEHVSRFGIAAVDDGRVARLVEKPAPADAPSRLAIGGRFALGAPARAALAAAAAAYDGPGEMGLTEWLAARIAEGMRVAAVPFAPGAERIDCGSPDGYRAALDRWESGPA